uniref:Uncharacterized protein n=1 Tax=Glossina austeni TaxID=7395 RepID=A0A1A9VX15_GLOAU
MRTFDEETTLSSKGPYEAYVGSLKPLHCLTFIGYDKTSLNHTTLKQQENFEKREKLVDQKMKENTISCRQFADKGVNAGEYLEKKSAKFMVRLEPKIKSSSRKATKSSLQNWGLRGEEDSNQALPVDSRTLTHKHVKSSVPKQKVVEVTNCIEDITGSRNRKNNEEEECEKGIKKLVKSDYRLLPISLFKERFEKIDNLEKLVASIREEINRMREIIISQEDLLQFSELYERVKELNSMIINLKSYDSSSSSKYSNAAETSDLKNSSIKPKLEMREKRYKSSRRKVVEDIEKKKGIPLTSISAIDAATIVAAAANTFVPPKHYEAAISGIDKHNMTIYGYRYWDTSSIQ